MQTKPSPAWIARLPRPIQQAFENDIARRVLKNSGYLFSATGIAALLSMLQGILVARLLSTSDYGALRTLIVFTSTINNLVSFRMGELVVKYIGRYTENKEHEHAAALFKAAAMIEMLASLVAFALICLLAPIGARYFAHDPSKSNLFVLYGLIVLANLIYESSMGLLQISDRFRRIAVLNVFQGLFILTATLLAYLSNSGLQGILLAYLGGKSMGALGYTIAALVEAGRRWGKTWWKASLRLLLPQKRELAHFAISTNLSATISLVTKDSELLWVSALRSTEESGYYGLALTLINFVEMPVAPMPQTTYPELSRQAARGNWGSMRSVLKHGSQIAGGYTLLAALGLTLLGQPLIGYVYGWNYLPAYPALVILLLGYLAANTFYWRRVALLALGRPDFPVKVNLVLALFKVVGTLVLTPRFGFLVSAALLAGFYWVGSLLAIWKANNLIAQREQEQK